MDARYYHQQRPHLLRLALKVQRQLEDPLLMEEGLAQRPGPVIGVRPGELRAELPWDRIGKKTWEATK